MRTKEEIEKRIEEIDFELSESTRVFKENFARLSDWDIDSHYLYQDNIKIERHTLLWVLNEYKND